MRFRVHIIMKTGQQDNYENVVSVGVEGGGLKMDYPSGSSWISLANIDRWEAVKDSLNAPEEPG